MTVPLSGSILTTPCILLAPGYPKRWVLASMVGHCRMLQPLNVLIKAVDYFVGLGISHEEASDLHHRYYVQYGLALRGLTRHHDVGSEIRNVGLISRF